MKTTDTPFRYPLFYQLPPSLKILYTMVLIILGIGYLFSMIQVYEVHAGRDGAPGLSVDDIRIAYSGNPHSSRIEAALQGPMSSMASAADKGTIISWARKGSDTNAYETTIKPILTAQCYGCHDGSNPNLPNLTSYDNVQKVSVIDTGVSTVSLVRVSHIHLFGLCFIFFVLGIIFTHSYVKRQVLKCIVIAAPFVAIILDIASWWLTKVSTPFAYMVMFGGALMAFSFAYQWTVSMYQLWLFRCPDGEVCQEVPRAERPLSDIRLQISTRPVVMTNNAGN